ncbi:hypothetical protein DdX_16005 [Ditylenchus destructor]|uniref:Apple domain-containing protein n=1 Tax=Ditylenchus destructor TaxID=166010 RepID=A0AAD4QUA3_9BILA|nr:hypothetical protein DdX_16005 [Ditylenchus destructor]
MLRNKFYPSCLRRQDTGVNNKNVRDQKQRSFATSLDEKNGSDGHQGTIAQNLTRSDPRVGKIESFNRKIDVRPSQERNSEFVDRTEEILNYQESGVEVILGVTSKCPGRVEFQTAPVGSLPRLNVTNDAPADSAADCARNCFEKEGCKLAGFIPTPGRDSASGVCLLTSDEPNESECGPTSESNSQASNGNDKSERSPFTLKKKKSAELELVRSLLKTFLSLPKAILFPERKQTSITRKFLLEVTIFAPDGSTKISGGRFSSEVKLYENEEPPKLEVFYKRALRGLNFSPDDLHVTRSEFYDHFFKCLSFAFLEEPVVFPDTNCVVQQNTTSSANISKTDDAYRKRRTGLNHIQVTNDLPVTNAPKIDETHVPQGAFYFIRGRVEYSLNRHEANLIN